MKNRILPLLLLAALAFAPAHAQKISADPTASALSGGEFLANLAAVALSYVAGFVVLVAPGVDIAKEYYLGMTVDRARGTVTMIAFWFCPSDVATNRVSSGTATRRAVMNDTSSLFDVCGDGLAGRIRR